MDIGVVVWANSLNYITTRLAIDHAAKIHHRRGYRIKLLCLSGYDLFKQTECESYGYEVINCEPFFAELAEKYANVRAIFSSHPRGDFFFNNTMRWFVLDKFLSGKKLSVDGDIVINRGSIDILDKTGIEFYYPESTCFVLISDDFMRSYTEIVDFLNRDTAAALEHIKTVSRERGIHQWGLSSVETTADLDEEKIACFAIHYGNLYGIPDDKRPMLACPPFIAHAWGNPPLGRYLAPEFHRFREGVEYTFVDDTHRFSEYPLAFMHYQEQLHYILGCHRLLNSLNVVDDVYAHLLTKDKVYRYLHGEIETKYPAIIRLLHNVSHHPASMNHNYWDMRDILSECEETGMAHIFNAKRWHSPSMFADRPNVSQLMIRPTAAE